MKPPGLALFFTHGISLQDWVEAGFLEREMSYYQRLGESVGGITFVTYGGVEDACLAATLEGIQVLPNRYGQASQRFSLTAPWQYRRQLASVRIFKSNQIVGAWTAMIAKWLFRGKLIVRGGHIRLIHATQDEANWPRLVRVWLAEAIGLWVADGVILATEEMVDYAVRVYKLPKKKIYLVPNFVETEVFTPSLASGEPGLIGFVGRFTPQKNLPALIEAVAGLDNVRLRLIGDGPLLSQLAAQARSVGVSVEFPGKVPNHDLPAYLSQCQAFAFPSHYEGHPKALLEAMACGLPVITTPVKGIKNLIQHRENGYLCADTSAAAISQGVRAVMQDETLRQHLARQARQYVVENFSLEKILERELDIYREMGLLSSTRPKNDHHTQS